MGMGWKAAAGRQREACVVRWREVRCGAASAGWQLDLRSQVARRKKPQRREEQTAARSTRANMAMNIARQEIRGTARAYGGAVAHAHHRRRPCRAARTMLSYRLGESPCVTLTGVLQPGTTGRGSWSLVFESAAALNLQSRSSAPGKPAALGAMSVSSSKRTPALSRVPRAFKLLPLVVLAFAASKLLPPAGPRQPQLMQQLLQAAAPLQPAPLAGGPAAAAASGTQRPLRVLMLSHELTLTGAPQVLYEIALHLRDQGHSIR